MNGPNDYANQTIEVVRNVATNDLIGRVAETGRHIAFSYTASVGFGDSVTPDFLRLKARAYNALAEAIESGNLPTVTEEVPF